MRKNIAHIYKLIRWALTILVLWHVWHNAHWSVALALSLISFSIEGIAATLTLHGKIIKAHIEGIRAAFSPENNEHT